MPQWVLIIFEGESLILWKNVFTRLFLAVKPVSAAKIGVAKTPEYLLFNWPIAPFKIQKKVLKGYKTNLSFDYVFQKIK